MPNTVNFNESYPNITKSNALYERAKKIMTPVTQTLAKGPTQFTKGVAPIYLARGKGARVWDVDGNEYLDYNMGIGPISLGYCYPDVDQAIIEQLQKGITFSLMHELEVEVCELIHEIIPNAEAVRISKTGADVCSAAIRIARAYTHRNKVLCCGYHGWHDWYICTTSRDKGIPQPVKDLTYTFNYNDINSVASVLDEDTACVILEPVVFEEPRNNFLQELQDLCRKNGTLLIFDEMWTGFRLALGGAQEYYQVKPDLAVYSKAVANGMPISFLTGKYEILRLFEEEVFFFTTFGGEALSLAATKATIRVLKEKKVPDYLNEVGKKLKEGYNQLAEKKGLGSITKCVGMNCRTMITFDPSGGDPLLQKTFVQQEMIKNGILWAGFHNMCLSHTLEEIEYTLQVYDKVLDMLKEGIESNNLAAQLKGEIVQPVFRKLGNFDTQPKN